MAAKPLVDTREIRTLVRSLNAVNKEFASGVKQELKAVGEKVASKIRSSSAPPHRTGKLRRVTRTSVRQGEISLVNKLPQANVWNWGGTIQPRGVPIHFPSTEFVYKPAVEATAQIERDLEALIDRLATRHGF